MRRVAAAVAAAATLALAAPAGRAQEPLPLPNQRDVDRILNPQAPTYENPLDKRIREGIKSIGLQPQPDLNDPGGAEPPPEDQPGLSATVVPRLDTNRDGFVSRDEYFDDRLRPPVVGSRGTERHVKRYRRTQSRFRQADRDGDGRLSSDEIDAMEGRRF